MTDIALTAAQVKPIFPHFAEIYTFVANTTITQGQAVYVIASSTGAGKIAPADGSAAGTAGVLGIALNGGGAGQAIAVLKRGHVYGFTVSALNYYVPLYLSDTDSGILGDTAGTVSVIVGRIVPMSDADLTRVLYVDCRWT